MTKCSDLSSKGSTELSAESMWILIGHDNHNVLNLVFSLCMSECLFKIQQGHCFIASTAHASCWSNHHMKACHTSSSYGFQVVSTFANLVLYHPWFCSIIIKPKAHFFLQSGHLNRYMHHYSLAQAEPLLSGEI